MNSTGSAQTGKGSESVEKLKQCPFCGGIIIKRFKYPFFRPNQHLKGSYVTCCKCGASSGSYETIDEAIKAWNERYTESEERP